MPSILLRPQSQVCPPSHKNIAAFSHVQSSSMSIDNFARLTASSRCGGSSGMIGWCVFAQTP